MGELIVYPWSGVVRPSVLHNARQTSSQKLLGPIKAKFYVEPPWEGGKIVFTASGSHDQDGRHAHIWQKPFKNFLLQNRGPNFTKLGM